ncbi:MAG: acetoacetate--CoA ligase [Gammaproteobacteria bacterium]|nr:MAG: acetoacetate--CoA ligase [Gammaproteobacteria bacterium]
MTNTNTPTPLWQPDEQWITKTPLSAYQRWLTQTRDLSFVDYAELWSWSVNDLDGFWSSIWDYFGIHADGNPRPALAAEQMPGASWFPNVKLNYAEQALVGVGPPQPGDRSLPALLAYSESSAAPGLAMQSINRGELADQVAQVAGALRELGVTAGDRVVGYVTNTPEALVAMLAAASLGAIWSSCAAEFGVASVVDRFQQIEPKVLFAVNGYRFNGKYHDRSGALQAIQSGLPTLEATLLLPGEAGNTGSELSQTRLWGDICGPSLPVPELTFERVPFDHPLWILYSSGTTGIPKAIAHSHGGNVIEHIKVLALHQGVTRAKPFFWFTTAGWMVWNLAASALLLKAPVVIYDGNPAFPTLDTLWRITEETEATCLGASAAFFQGCEKAGLKPGQAHDLKSLETLISTGSPLSPQGFEWIYSAVKQDLWLTSASGGTDVCSAFVGGVPGHAVYSGEIQGASLGAAVYAFNDAGEAVIDEVGELVLTRPMPSMPPFFWNDTDGKRYQESYFDMWPGVWRHGDFIKFTARGSCIIYGRSDSTLNRKGVRIGTAEIYNSLETLPQLQDSMVTERSGGDGQSLMVLFIVLGDGVSLDDQLRTLLSEHLRQSLSPRHVPDEIYAVLAIPYTLTGKKMEVPVRRLLAGVAQSQALSRDAMANPEALDGLLAAIKE